mmetsp:Transcript_98243/g.174921  ORF Transcript_98243/g.174921 Transcript_98243/m.174921 type:complete len:227 (-) Transcript_98243:37-717(-)
MHGICLSPWLRRCRPHGFGRLFCSLDPYSLLGIAPRASQLEIKAAYRRLALKTHPDRHGGSAEDFKRAALAYEMLSDPTSKLAKSGRAWHYTPPANWGAVAGPLRQGPLRTVSEAEAERIFREVFGGRSVKQVLEDEADRRVDGSLVDHGIFSACIREAMFTKLLLEAQAKAEMQKHVGHGESSTITTREKLTTEDGKGFIKVKHITYWWDGRVETDVIMKERHRL